MLKNRIGCAHKYMVSPIFSNEEVNLFHHLRSRSGECRANYKQKEIRYFGHCQLLFNFRTRMIPVKCNFKRKYKGNLWYPIRRVPRTSSCLSNNIEWSFCGQIFRIHGYFWPTWIANQSCELFTAVGLFLQEKWWWRNLKLSKMRNHEH